MRRARSASARRLSTVLLTVAVAGAGLAGCTSDDGGHQPTATSTPLAQVDTRAASVTRGAFCDRLSAAGIEHALGAAVTDHSSYASGDRASIADGVKDVAHEFSCAFTTEDGTTARAWVFAPPVTRDRARDLVAFATEGAGCSELAEAPTFGRPGIATRCVADGSTTVTFAGLFADAWLSCSLTVPVGQSAADLPDRAGSWCVTVLAAAAPA